MHLGIANFLVNNGWGSKGHGLDPQRIAIALKLPNNDHGFSFIEVIFLI
jgi:hypothetical protein